MLLMFTKVALVTVPIFLKLAKLSEVKDHTKILRRAKSDISWKLGAGLTAASFIHS